jgi:cation-transporting ATPase E
MYFGSPRPRLYARPGDIHCVAPAASAGPGTSRPTRHATGHSTRAIPGEPAYRRGMSQAAAQAALLQGLTTAEVDERIDRGEVNVVERHTSRTFGGIVRANVLTRFNAILGALLVVILIVGPLQDAVFGFILIANTLIGIVQEVRAKRTLDRLSLVTAPRVRIVRDGRLEKHRPDDVVIDDLVEVSAGDQIVVDGRVCAADSLEVDESLVTGESEPVDKHVGDTVLSGSFVVAGSGRFVATAVGETAYAARLATEARKFTLVRSELRDGINRLLRFITWVMAPTAVLLVWSQLANRENLGDALRGSVAGVVTMVPEGLVLLTSIAFAVGVIRLAKRRVVVQELPAIEGLARVDVLCLDKTGTLTDGSFEVVDLVPLDPADEAGARATAALSALAAADPHPNASLRALATAYPSLDGGRVRQAYPFSSARKWSGADLGQAGVWLLGAPEILLDAAAGDTAALRRDVDERAAAGRRVLLLARAPGPPAGDTLPSGLVPAALAVLAERTRPQAAQTLRYFAEEGVRVMVISGDHPRTVGAVAAQLGLAGADEPVDARTLPEGGAELADVVESATVLGRVLPHQKRAIVGALQSRGHVVAMTGDGVNDVLALKDSDIGIAIGSGAEASRAVAQLVMIDGDFDVLPGVLAEGRRVIGNIERVANLFLTKTVYATLLALTIGVGGLPFPFLPRHLTLVSTFTIGVPAFFLALGPNAARARAGFLGRVLRFAVPSGVVAAAATFVSYAEARELPQVSLGEARTTATLTLFAVALWVLAILARPLTPARRLLVGAMVAGFVSALAIPPVRDFFALPFPPLIVVLAAIGTVALADIGLEFGWRLAQEIGYRWGGGPNPDDPATSRGPGLSGVPRPRTPRPPRQRR